MDTSQALHGRGHHLPLLSRLATAVGGDRLLHQGYGLFEFVSISSVINKARGQYERSFLLSESDDNDLTYFLLAQVKVIQQAIASLHAYLEAASRPTSLPSAGWNSICRIVHPRRKPLATIRSLRERPGHPCDR